jgi:anaerobic selenocysteine-containing dehydrogenase/Fe-S-cluster-containing dehydrogenase component
MLVTVENGRITRIEGDPLNPATDGRVCVKGLSYARRVASPDRLLHPLRRTASGGFERVSWNAALDDIAERLDRVRQAQGPEAVLYYEASGSHGALGRLAMAFWHQFGGCTLTYGDLCWPAGLEATRLTYGTNLHNHPRLTAESRFILVWGHNPAETNVHQWRLILDAQQSGARVAVIDPRSTDTTDAGDVHLQPRPGTDGALALGLARAIVDDGLEDRAFLAAHAAGVDGYLARLRDYPLERVASITGVPVQQIRSLAREYARTRPALLVAGFGLQRNHQAGQTMRAVSLLPALTGNVGVAGGGWQYANLASHVLGDVPLPPEPDAVRRGLPVSQLGPGLAALRDPPVAAAWVEKGNPASQNPRSPLVRDALSRLDLLVVVDQRLTDTARLAHYVLPAKSLFEEEDVCTAYWHPYVQRRAKVLEPPGEVKTETEIWRLLSSRLGFDTSWFPADEHAARTMLEGMLPTGLTLEGLACRPGLAAGVKDVAFEDRVFPTPSGRIEFTSADAARLWSIDAVPVYEPLGEGHESALALRFPLQLLSCKTRDRIHSQFGNVDWVRQVERPHLLDIHPADAAARGLAEGDVAAVFNDRGRVEVGVRLDAGLRPGVVHVLEGRCHDRDPDVNALTDAGVTDINHGGTFYECLVEVKRVAEVRTPRVGLAARSPAPRRQRTLKAGREPKAQSREPSFVLDLARCVGCAACVIACRLENGWSDGTAWRRVLPVNLRRRPGGPTYFLSVACHHCDRPACVAACPSGAYEQRPDGIVIHHEERCIGCRYCEMACPFGAPRYDEEKKVMTKCHFCHHRDEGPACVAACPTGALQSGAPEPAGASRESVPGFTDAAGCRPATRFLPPRGARREALLRALEERLARR